MREVLPARHLGQALVTGAEFYAQYGVWAHKLIPFPQSWRLGIFLCVEGATNRFIGRFIFMPKIGLRFWSA